MAREEVVSLSMMLRQRAADSNPVRIGQIGAGKFGTMFLSQCRLTVGMHLAGLADLSPQRAQERLRSVGWPAEQTDARSVDEAITSGKTCVTDDAMAVITDPRIEVVIEATGDPSAGIRHALAAIAHGKHIVMVNVEADALAGPLLAKRAREAGIIYSMAWGDQPALIAEHVDWARTCGFNVVCAGKGTRYLPSYHQSTPDTVWDILESYIKIRDRSQINPKMFNSFLDGTKSAIEMTAVCNATGLVPQTSGLSFPPASRFEHANVCRPKSEGGVLEKKGVTEVTSSLYRDGRDVPNHLAMGTYVVIETDSDYARQCFAEYTMLPDSSGRYASLYRPTHMIGLELGFSVASVVLRGEATGSTRVFNSDVCAVAKRGLRKAELLDGEGGFCVWGRQTPAEISLAKGYLPLGLAHGMKLKREIAQGQAIHWSDVDFDPNDSSILLRREMEAYFGRNSMQLS
jgi:predicted homoserine dehydrogenase-like protein